MASLFLQTCLCPFQSFDWQSRPQYQAWVHLVQRRLEAAPQFLHIMSSRSRSTHSIMPSSNNTPNSPDPNPAVIWPIFPVSFSRTRCLDGMSSLFRFLAFSPRSLSLSSLVGDSSFCSNWSKSISSEGCQAWGYRNFFSMRFKNKGTSLVDKCCPTLDVIIMF